MINTELQISRSSNNVLTRNKEDEALKQRAKEFEAVFITQMLKHSGFEKALGSGGGFGGENFSSLLLEQYASQMVDNGGFGLAEHIYAQLKEKQVGDEK